MKTYSLTQTQAELVTACLYARAVWLEDQLQRRRMTADRRELKRLSLALRLTRKTVVLFETKREVITEKETK